MKNKMLKRRYREDKQRNSDFGHGKQWFRGERIGNTKFGSVFLASWKKPKFRPPQFPIQMAVKSAEMSVSDSIQSEKQVLDDLQGSCKYIRTCFGEELTTTPTGNQEIYNLLLEHAPGGTLADLMRKYRYTANMTSGLPEVAVRRYTKCILLALLSAHKHGYVVRNLKPENIILVPSITVNDCCGEVEYVAKIGDFGSAMDVETIEECGLSDLDMGRDVRYMSPEALVEEMQLPASDIWALGCIVVEMLTGKSIWGRKRDTQIEGDLRRMAEGKCLLWVSKLGKFSKAALSFLSRCLDRKPEERYTAASLLSEPFVAGVLLDGEEDHEAIDHGDDDAKEDASNKQEGAAGLGILKEDDASTLGNEEEATGFGILSTASTHYAEMRGMDIAWSDSESNEDSIGYRYEEWTSDEEREYFLEWNEEKRGLTSVDSLGFDSLD